MFSFPLSLVVGRSYIVFAFYHLLHVSFYGSSFFRVSVNDLDSLRLSLRKSLLKEEGREGRQGPSVLLVPRRETFFELRSRSLH